MFRVRLRELREAAGFKSQQAFADAFGVAQSTVGNWEAGKREPNFETAIRLAQFFGVSVDSLLLGEKVPASEPESGNPWVERLQELSPSDLFLFGQVLDSLKANPTGTRAALGLALTAAQSVPQAR